jgi:hypothetical protein
MIRNHFIAWQAANISNAPRLASVLSIVERAAIPLEHVTRQRHLFDRARKGDAIWLLGRYASLSAASASLIGCIIVDEKIIDGEIFRFKALPESFWLGWNDISQLFSTLEFLRGASSRTVFPDIGLAQQFQTTRQVAHGSQEKLAKYAEKLKARPKLFLSYRWGASTDLMKYLLPAIDRLGYSAWVDRWSGPRRFKSSGRLEPEETVRELLGGAIADSQILLAIADEGYHSAVWTSFEYRAAKDAGIRICEVTAQSLRGLSTRELVDFLRGALPEQTF